MAEPIVKIKPATDGWKSTVVPANGKMMDNAQINNVTILFRKNKAVRIAPSDK
jgi:hypothetical protein